MQERLLLASERIQEIAFEYLLPDEYSKYFNRLSKRILHILDKQTNDYSVLTLKELKEYHDSLFQEFIDKEYEHSYANLEYCETCFKDNFEVARIFSFLYVEMNILIECVYEQRFDRAVRYLELFIECYGLYVYVYQYEQRIPTALELKLIVEQNFKDYAVEEAIDRVETKLKSHSGVAAMIIERADLSDERYLYQYGEYISVNEIETMKYFNQMSQSQLEEIAFCYTNGFKIGFEKKGVLLSDKKLIQIVYPIGFERLVRVAVNQFRKMGVEPVFQRNANSVFHKRGMRLSGYYSTPYNRQLLFDHREDEAIVLSKNYLNKKLLGYQKGYEKFKELAKGYAGPAWIEVFGEEKYDFIQKKQCVQMNKKQQQMSTQYYVELTQIINKYIDPRERSFTIIAFPIPQIGEFYPQIMEETIAINSLDYKTYEAIQQTVIDALDQTQKVVIKGSGENQTDLTISLHERTDPQKETIFENCVSDVNIPLGEVFTTPILKGTNGVLHVPIAYLNDMVFYQLKFVFEDGYVTSYSCENFEDISDNQKYIKDHILYHHETLPIGEFAIGTNTRAYKMADKYKIHDLLPILIAEKTGPHFALGDTCYSYDEETKVFNDNGKEVIAKDNERSRMRNTNLGEAYYSCHTDITLPYHEIGELYGVKMDMTKVPIIREGKFVLEGTDLLNEALNS